MQEFFGSLRHDAVSVQQLFDRVCARHERACADAGVTLAASIEPGAETILGDADRRALSTAADALNRATEPFATKRMNRSIARALTGRSVDSLAGG